MPARPVSFVSPNHDDAPPNPESFRTRHARRLRRHPQGAWLQVRPAQRAAAQRLQGLYSELIAFKAARRGTIRKLLARPKQPRSVYFWGGGRGKSFLMDCFYDSVPYQRKRRVHFHAFMQEVQNDLKNLNHEPDPLQKVADRIARQTRLLCFDEFHVSDIADAMILGRLLDALFARGTVFVMTSNYPPDGSIPMACSASTSCRPSR
jgi:cell division protein ZapE